jgi:hypothetical protein
MVIEYCDGRSPSSADQSAIERGNVLIIIEDGNPYLFRLSRHISL